MAKIVPHPCPICGATPARREQLPGDFELCTRCGFAIRVDENGELVAWATTNQSHPGPGRAARLLRAASSLVLIAATLSGCALAQAGAMSAQPARAPEITSGVLQLISARALGHGCPVTETLLLTARHMATAQRLSGPPEPVDVTWSDADGYSGSAVTVAIDARRDLALMRADRAFRRWYPPAATAPEIGETVVIVGYDYRDRLHRQIVRAEIVNLIATHLVLSQPGQPGFSGSCVIDTAGRAVGIFVAAVGPDSARHGLAVAIYGEWMPWWGQE